MAQGESLTPKENLTVDQLRDAIVTEYGVDSLIAQNALDQIQRARTNLNMRNGTWTLVELGQSRMELSLTREAQGKGATKNLSYEFEVTTVTQNGIPTPAFRFISEREITASAEGYLDQKAIDDAALSRIRSERGKAALSAARPFIKARRKARGGREERI